MRKLLVLIAFLGPMFPAPAATPVQIDDNRTAFRAATEAKLEAWNRALDDAESRMSPAKADYFARRLDETRRDLSELDETFGADARDVKARIVARLQELERAQARMAAE